MNQQLIQINPAEYGLQAKEASTIEKAFIPMLETMAELENEFNAIISQVKEAGITAEGMGAARELRLKYVKTRTGTEEIHKKAKAYYLAGGRFVDGWKNAQKFASQGKEEALMQIEKHFENEEKKRLEALKTERTAKLCAVGYMDTVTGVELFTDEIFANFLAGAEKQVKDQKEQEEKQRLEDERLAKVAQLKTQRKNALFPFGNLVEPGFDFEVLGEMPQNEFDAVLNGLQNKKEQQEKEQAEERAKAEAAQKKALEEKQKAEAQAEAERKEKENIAAQLRAKEDQERKRQEEIQKAQEAVAVMPQNELFELMLNDMKRAVVKYEGKFSGQENDELYKSVIVLVGKIDAFVNEKLQNKKATK